MTFLGTFENTGLKKKICCRYEIKYADEDAIDECRVLKEFYTGRQDLNKIFFKNFLSAALFIARSSRVTWRYSMKRCS